MKRIDWLTSLRGIGCSIVLFAHIIASDPFFGKYASGCGKIGVWLFMLLSGMLLIYPYIYNNFFTPKDVIPFYKKKAIKLLPVYLLALALIFVLRLSPLSDLRDYLCMQTAWGHFWYMPVIIKFYLLAPAVLYLLSVLKHRLGYVKGIYYFAGVISLAGILLSIMFPFTSYVENSIQLVWYMPTFIMGMLLAIVVNRIQMQENVSCDFLIAIPVLGILIVTPLFRQIIFGIEPSGYLQNKYLYMSAMWSIIIFLCSKSKYVKKWMEGAVIGSMLGDLSYYIYLFHYIVLIYLRSNWNISTVAAGLITILITLILAKIMKEFDNVLKIYLTRNI